MGRVGLKGFYEREEIYNPNGIRTANSVKRIFKLISGKKYHQKNEGKHNISGVAFSTRKFRVHASTSHRQKGQPFAYMLWNLELYASPK
jgi:hypothetical protein